MTGPVLPAAQPAQPIGEISVLLGGLVLILTGPVAIMRPRSVQAWWVKILKPFEPYPLQGHIESEEYLFTIRIWGIAAILMGPIALYFALKFLLSY